jgi:hypothetical protein
MRPAGTADRSLLGHIAEAVERDSLHHLRLAAGFARRRGCGGFARPTFGGGASLGHAPTILLRLAIALSRASATSSSGDGSGSLVQNNLMSGAPSKPPPRQLCQLVDIY